MWSLPCFHVVAVSNSTFDNIDGGNDDDDLLVNMLAEDEQKTEGEDKGTIYIYYMHIVCFSVSNHIVFSCFLLVTGIIYVSWVMLLFCNQIKNQTEKERNRHTQAFCISRKNCGALIWLNWYNTQKKLRGATRYKTWAPNSPRKWEEWIKQSGHRRIHIKATTKYVVP